MSGHQYYSILGLNSSATDAEVKRRFRELAKQYHPDRNPNEDATAKFQRLLEAYERIIKKDFDANTGFVSKSNQGNRGNHEAQHREFHRKAWERYEQMRKEQEAYSKEVFMAFTSGYRMRIKRIIGICCFALFAVLIADETLPLKPIHDRVVEYNSTSYQSFTHGYVNEVSTRYGHHFFLANYTPTLFNEQSEITYYQTAISRSDVYVSHNGKSIEVHFTYYWARWFLYLLFVLGIIIPFYRKDTILLYLSTYMSLYVISGVVCSYVLLNYRILSIITLGNWP
jgi:hemerythrin